jgi:hypothetical protein
VSIGIETANIVESSALSFSVNAGSNADRFLVVAIAYIAAAGTVTGVTYAGQSMTNIRARTQYADGTAELWGIVNPASGSNTLAITGTTARYSVAIPLYGVEQTSVAAATRSANDAVHTGGAFTVGSLTGVQSTDLVVGNCGAAYIYSDGISWSNLTERAEGQNSGAGVSAATDFNVSAPAGTAGGSYGAAVAAALIEASASASIIPLIAYHRMHNIGSAL